MTRRELVKNTLEFQNTGDRVPRDLWTLPWADLYHASELKAILAEFPPDIVQVPDEAKRYAKPLMNQGSVYEPGDSVDEYGVKWKNIQAGLVGEVKEPVVAPDDEDWDDTSRVHFPEELFTLDVERVNAFCASTDQFVLSSDLVRPFERMQFMRGTEELYCDLALRTPGMLKMLDRMHTFGCRLLETWAQTDVDGLFVMDDWGTQISLLINPADWRELFKPLYREYAQIAHKYGKKLFFHSDGYTLDIIPDLIEIGFDAVNLQIFCIGVEQLAPFKGKITFWGEIDRQHLLPHGTLADINEAVKKVYDTLWADGGVIGQCEFGAGAKPDNVREIYSAWAKMRSI